MQARKNPIIVIILLLLLYPCSLFAQPHYRLVQKARYAFQNSLTASGGIGMYCGEIGAGVSAEYQRFVDKQGLLSVDIKGAIFTSGTIGVAREGDTRIKINGNYVAPGARYHFVGNTHIADFGVGIFVPLGGIVRKETTFLDNGGNLRVLERSGFLSGIMGEMTLDIRPKGSFTIGAFMNVGALFTAVRTGAEGEVNGMCFNLGLRIGSFL